MNTGDVILIKGKSHKAKGAWELIAADEDGVISDAVEYKLGELLAQGDICQIFKATSPGGEEGIAKVCLHPCDNDLVEHEAEILRGLVPTKDDEPFYHYLPKLLKTLKQGDVQINITTYYEGVSLADIIKAYPAGIDFRDAVWMFKRLLAALGFAHSKDIIHGAVIPPHFLVHPTGHDARLIDWSYAEAASRMSGRPEFDRIVAISLAYEAFYPPEVMKKQKPGTQTDIFMAAKCWVALVGGDVVTNTMPTSVPKAVQDFMLDCLQEGRLMRPDDAWDLHEAFDNVIQGIVGKPKYRPFTMPGFTAKERT